MASTTVPSIYDTTDINQLLSIVVNAVGKDSVDSVANNLAVLRTQAADKPKANTKAAVKNLVAVSRAWTKPLGTLLERQNLRVNNIVKIDNLLLAVAQKLDDMKREMQAKNENIVTVVDWQIDVESLAAKSLYLFKDDNEPRDTTPAEQLNSPTPKPADPAAKTLGALASKPAGDTGKLFSAPSPKAPGALTPKPVVPAIKTSDTHPTNPVNPPGGNPANNSSPHNTPGAAGNHPPAERPAPKQDTPAAPPGRSAGVIRSGLADKLPATTTASSKSSKSKRQGDPAGYEEISDTDEPNKPKMGTYAQSDSLAAEEGAGSTGAKKSKNTGKGKQKAIPVEAIEEDDEESKDEQKPKKTINKKQKAAAAKTAKEDEAKKKEGKKPKKPNTRGKGNDAEQADAEADNEKNKKRNRSSTGASGEPSKKRSKSSIKSSEMVPPDADKDVSMTDGDKPAEEVDHFATDSDGPLTRGVARPPQGFPKRHDIKAFQRNGRKLRDIVDNCGPCETCAKRGKTCYGWLGWTCLNCKDAKQRCNFSLPDKYKRYALDRINKLLKDDDTIILHEVLPDEDAGVSEMQDTSAPISPTMTHSDSISGTPTPTSNQPSTLDAAGNALRRKRSATLKNTDSDNEGGKEVPKVRVQPKITAFFPPYDQQIPLFGQASVASSTTSQFGMRRSRQSLTGQASESSSNPERRIATPSSAFGILGPSRPRTGEGSESSSIPGRRSPILSSAFPPKESSIPNGSVEQLYGRYPHATSIERGIAEGFSRLQQHIDQRFEETLQRLREMETPVDSMSRQIGGQIGDMQRLMHELMNRQGHGQYVPPPVPPHSMFASSLSPPAGTGSFVFPEGSNANHPHPPPASPWGELFNGGYNPSMHYQAPDGSNMMGMGNYTSAGPSHNPGFVDNSNNTAGHSGQQQHVPTDYTQNEHRSAGVADSNDVTLEDLA